jgi:hypothetical protein
MIIYKFEFILEKKEESRLIKKSSFNVKYDCLLIVFSSIFQIH